MEPSIAGIVARTLAGVFVNFASTEYRRKGPDPFNTVVPGFGGDSMAKLEREFYAALLAITGVPVRFVSDVQGNDPTSEVIRAASRAAGLDLVWGWPVFTLDAHSDRFVLELNGSRTGFQPLVPGVLDGPWRAHEYNAP